MEPAEARRWLDRIRRLQGVVLWDQAYTHATRLQERRSKLAALRAELGTLDDSIARLSGAEAQFAETVVADFSRLRSESARLGEAVALAITDREERLAMELREGVRREMARVQRYLLTARVAIARTTDQLAGAGLLPENFGEVAE